MAQSSTRELHVRYSSGAPQRASQRLILMILQISRVACDAAFVSLDLLSISLPRKVSRANFPGIVEKIPRELTRKDMTREDLLKAFATYQLDCKRAAIAAAGA